MSADQPFVTFGQVAAVLRQLSKERRVGTLFITTADNKSASISLLGGEIVGVSFRVLRGRDALLLIRNIGLSRCTFHDGKVPDTDPDLPPTHEILAMFGTPEPVSPQQAQQQPPPPPPPPPAARPAGPGPEVRKIQQILEKELVEFLGPMAKVICREHVDKAGALASPAELRRLVDALAGEISDRNKAEAFRRAAWDKLPG